MRLNLIAKIAILLFSITFISLFFISSQNSAKEALQILGSLSANILVFAFLTQQWEEVKQVNGFHDKYMKLRTDIASHFAYLHIAVGSKNEMNILKSYDAIVLSIIELTNLLYEERLSCENNSKIQSKYEGAEGWLQSTFEYINQVTDDLDLLLHESCPLRKSHSESMTNIYKHRHLKELLEYKSTDKKKTATLSINMLNTQQLILKDFHKFRVISIPNLKTDSNVQQLFRKTS